MLLCNFCGIHTPIGKGLLRAIRYGVKTQRFCSQECIQKFTLRRLDFFNTLTAQYGKTMAMGILIDRETTYELLSPNEASLRKT
jgi:hypothetical protein